MKWLIMGSLALAALSGAAHADKVTQNAPATTIIHKTQPTVHGSEGIWRPSRPTRPTPPNGVQRGLNGGQHAGGSKH